MLLIRASSPVGKNVLSVHAAGPPTPFPMRLLTVALPDGTTTAARRDGEAFSALTGLGGVNYADVGALLRGGLETAVAGPLPGSARLVRPVLEPAATVCVGVNYGAHMREMGRET